MICIVIRAYSTAAFMGILAAGVLCAAVFIFTRSGKKQMLTLTALASFAIMTALNFTGTIRALQITAENSGTYTLKNCFLLTDINISGNELTLYSDHEEITITLDETGASAYGNGKKMCSISSELNALPGEYSAVSAKLDNGLLQLGQHRTKTIFWILYTSCLHLFRHIAQFVLARRQTEKYST